MIDRQHLSIVRELNRTGSITAAAEKLNVSQSALSHAIAKLEARHGAKIWDRQGRHLRLTRAGEHLLQLAERFLPELEHAEAMLSELARGRRGILRIGGECHPCERWLMAVTGPYLTRWSDVDIDVRTTFRFDGVDALRAHEIDLLATPDPIHAPDLRFVPTFDYELRLIVPEAHPLAQRDHVVAEDFVAETLFTLPVGVERLDIYSRVLVPADCRPSRRVEIGTPELMLQLVSANRGITVMPDWLVAESGSGLPVRSIRIGEKGLQKSINLGFREKDNQTDFIVAFVEMAKRTPAPISLSNFMRPV